MPAIVANTKGVMYFNMGRLPEAVAEYKKAIQIVPNSSLSYQNLAVVLNGMGDERAARAALEAAATAEGPRSASVYRIGMALIKNNLPQLGVPYVMEAASGNGPNAADANFVLGVQAGNEGVNDKAEEYLRAAVSHRPSWGEAAYSLAKILERRGKSAEAKTYYEQAQRLGYPSR